MRGKLVKLCSATVMSATVIAAPAFSQVVAVAAVPEATKADPGTKRRGEVYQLGVGDKLRITIYEREDLSKVYDVNDGGKVHIPFLGVFEVAGWNVGRLEQAIRDQYKSVLGQEPQVIVEIDERRPFFVVGLVNRPGSYPFVPRMSALHGVAIAGGVYRLGNNAFLTADARRETTRLEQTREDLKRALARLARLKAEKVGQDKPVRSPRLEKIAGKKLAVRLLDIEARLQRQRQLSHQRRIEAFEIAIKLHGQEASTLREQLSFIRTQKELKAQHSAEIQKLQRRGLANRVQALNLRGDVSALERDFRAAIAGVTRARQELAEAERDFSLYKYNHALEIDQQIADLQLEIIKFEAAMRGSQNFIRQVTGMTISPDGTGMESGVNYQILRQVGGQTEILAAAETTPLQPGDILRVLPKDTERFIQ